MKKEKQSKTSKESPPVVEDVENAADVLTDSKTDSPQLKDSSEAASEVSSKENLPPSKKKTQLIYA